MKWFVVLPLAWIAMSVAFTLGYGVGVATGCRRAWDRAYASAYHLGFEAGRRPQKPAELRVQHALPEEERHPR